jgi:hypothetical protein
LILGPAIFDGQVLALNKARVFQALAEGTQAVVRGVKRCGVKKPDHRHRLLRARRERPRRRRAAEQRDELMSDMGSSSLSGDGRCGQSTTHLACRGLGGRSLGDT